MFPRMLIRVSLQVLHLGILALVGVVLGCEPGPWDERASSPSAAPRPARASGRRAGNGAPARSRQARPGSARGGRPLVQALGMRTSGSESAATAPREGTSHPALERGVTKDGSPWIGGRNAKVVIEEFSDFGCPFCRLGAQVMHRLLQHYGRRIRLVFRHMPVTSLHPDSELAAQASMAALAQGKFWEMHDLLFSHQDAHSLADLLSYAKQLGLDVARFKQEILSGRYRAKVRKDAEEAERRGVQGTPTFFVTGVGKVEGAQPYETFERIIDRALSASSAER